jgi:exonuclease SbcC
MVAFGAFASVQEIDFQLLGDSPLFLINGPTGSGKTTILDAISYALYGETTGNERQGQEMRCSHARDDLLTEVELEFKLADCRYRIRRIPRQERPRVRGEGTTVQPPEAQLWELNGNGEEKELLVPKKTTEATANIVQLTGLSAEQFRQVMVLPQGRFRELLLADSRQREEIFQQLFQTRIYTRLEAQLKVQASELVNQLELLQEQERGILESIEEENSEALLLQIEALTQELRTQKSKQQEAEEAVKKLRQQLNDARNLQQQFRNLKEAGRQLEKLLWRGQQLDRDKTQLSMSEKAKQLQPLYEGWQRSIHEWEKAESAAKKAKEQHRRSLEALRSHELAWEKIVLREPELEELKHQQQQLRGYAERARQLQQSLDVQKKIQAEYEARLLAEKKRDREVQCLRSEAEALDKRMERDLQRLKHMPDKQRTLEVLEQERQQLEALDELKLLQAQEQRALSIATQSEKLVLEQLHLLRQRQQQMQQAWEQGQAAVLAGQLQPDMPCAVCGSKDHPHPALPEGKLVTEQERKENREALESAQVQLQNIKADVAASNARMEALSKQQQKLSGHNQGMSVGNIQQLATDIEVVKQTLTQLQKIQKESESHLLQRMVLREALKDTERLLKQIQKQRTDVAKQLAAADQDVLVKRGELPEQYGTPSSLEKAIAEANAKLDILQRQIQKTRAAVQQARVAEAGTKAARETVEQALCLQHEKMWQEQKKWQQALTGSDFSSESAFVQMMMPEDAMQELIEKIRRQDDALLAARTLVKEKKAALQGKVPPDPEPLERTFRQHEEASRQLTETCHRAAQILQQLKSIHKKLESNHRRQAELNRQYAVLGRLADVANGKNIHKLSLHRFVLSVLLDDVLISARQRLLHMSKGRYQLLRREDVRDGRSGSGLDLVVEDAFSGKSRPVATLSGGESFMAALALALGLSEVVQAYAGGIRLDSLFIDEGFGSLDPESLDLAINTLLDLQSGGRMVGIISHVPELKERIDVRLDITAERSGSMVIPVLL